jgi:catechol 2,3-dioxygenase-like lactoylglutathione lyase family enzyme
MGIGLSAIKHVKLPVTDLRRSTAWYRDLFDFEVATEYFEDGAVRGVQLRDPDAGIELALRQREYCAGPPEVAGFDVFAFRAPTDEVVTAVAERCDRLGVGHSGIWRQPGYGAGFDIPDPDGTLVRIVWHDPQGPLATGFLGVDSDADGLPGLYAEPRLDLSAD